MQVLVILALLIQTSLTFHTGGNPYVYDTHDDYHQQHSNRRIMILSQPLRSFQQVPQFRQSSSSFGPTQSFSAQQVRQSFMPQQQSQFSSSFAQSRRVSPTFPESRIIRSSHNVQPQPTVLPSRPSPVPGCNPNNPLIDETRNGRSYHFSWCHDNGKSYTWENANLYCMRLGSGFHAVSIEDQHEDAFITNIIKHNDIPWIWTSGNKRHTTYWVWADGSRITYTNWSHTGGSDVPQPDNRENSNEKCLAILKNFYQDGIKWHDIGCHHHKPVICESS